MHKNTSSDILSRILDEMEKEDAWKNQQVNANGRFLCGFPRCSKT